MEKFSKYMTSYFEKILLRKPASLKCIACGNDSEKIPGLCRLDLSKNCYFLCYECDYEVFKRVNQTRINPCFITFREAREAGRENDADLHT